MPKFHKILQEKNVFVQKLRWRVIKIVGARKKRRWQTRNAVGASEKCRILCKNRQKLSKKCKIPLNLAKNYIFVPKTRWRAMKSLARANDRWHATVCRCGTEIAYPLFSVYFFQAALKWNNSRIKCKRGKFWRPIRWIFFEKNLFWALKNLQIL